MPIGAARNMFVGVAWDHGPGEGQRVAVDDGAVAIAIGPVGLDGILGLPRLKSP